MKDPKSHAREPEAPASSTLNVAPFSMIPSVATPAATAAAAVKSKFRILLVDDHPMVRQGLARLINDEADLCVCGEADSASAALAMLNSVQPDLAVVDISMGGVDGIELVKELRNVRPQMPTLVLSMHDESLYAERVLRAGAKGYVTKQEAPDKVMTAIRRVLAGDVYVSQKIASRLLKAVTGPQKEPMLSPLDRLSDRELQVFRLIGSGLSVREIAEKLFLSVKTIETHREHIKEKLNLKSAAELLRYAVQYGINTA
jgi:DNA-binding NarL/FixJ family response regulator